MLAFRYNPSRANRLMALLSILSLVILKCPSAIAAWEVWGKYLGRLPYTIFDRNQQRIYTLQFQNSGLLAITPFCQLPAGKGNTEFTFTGVQGSPMVSSFVEAYRSMYRMTHRTGPEMYLSVIAAAIAIATVEQSWSNNSLSDPIVSVLNSYHADISRQYGQVAFSSSVPGVSSEPANAVYSGLPNSPGHIVIVDYVRTRGNKLKITIRVDEQTIVWFLALSDDHLSPDIDTTNKLPDDRDHDDSGAGAAGSMPGSTPGDSSLRVYGNSRSSGCQTSQRGRSTQSGRKKKCPIISFQTLPRK